MSNRVLVKIMALTLACGLAACGTMQYVPKTDHQGGYSHTQLAPDVFDVHYSGHGRYDPERVSDFLLLRSAELCADAGYAYFETDAALQSHTISSAGTPWLVPDMPAPASVIRTECFQAPSSEAATRLASRFITRTLREKYALNHR